MSEIEEALRQREERVTTIADLLQTAAAFPHLRLGQLLVNATAPEDTSAPWLFHLSDAELRERLRAYRERHASER